MAANPPPPVEVWAENWLAVQVFAALQTQWRIGMHGATGLDYAVLPTVMSLHGVKKSRRAELFAAIRVMETEALTVFAEKNG